MPMIETKTNVAISDEQELALKSALGKAISILPGKSEQWLMLSFSDNARMYFKGNKAQPIAYVEIKVFGKINPAACEKLTAEVCSIFGSILNIPPSNTYVKYEEVSLWGWNGTNF